MKRRVFPWRGMPGLKPPTPVDRQLIRDMFPRRWQRLEEQGPLQHLAERLNAIVQECSGNFAERALEVDTEAALAARSDFRNRCDLADSYGHAVREPFLAGLVCDWVERRGVVFAVEALTRATEFRIHYEQGLIKAADALRYARAWHLEPQVGPSVFQFPLRAPSGWAVLRHYLAVADEASYAAAREVASILREDPEVELCAGLAFLFPTEGWADALLAQRQLKYEQWTPFVSKALGASVGSPEAALRLKRHEDSLPTLIARLGAASLPAIPDELDLLVRFEGREAVERIVPFFEERSTRARVVEYLNRVPELAIRVLQPIAAGEVVHTGMRPGVILGRAISRKLAAACLKTVVSRSSDEAEPTGKTRKVAGRQPDLSGIPVLDDPPWLKKTARQPASVPGLIMLAYPERVEIDEADREHAREFAVDWEARPRPAQDLVARRAEQRKEFERLIQWGERNQDSGDGKDFFRDAVDREVALELWNHPQARWQLASYYDPDLERGEPLFLARVIDFGLEALPGIFNAPPDSRGTWLPLLAHYASPRVALPIADGLRRARALKAVAHRWLTTHAEVAAIGLIPPALAEPPDETARLALRHLEAHGHGVVIRQVAARYGQDAASAIEILLDPWLQFPARLPASSKRLPANALAPIRLKSGRLLPEAAVQHLCTMLAFTSLDSPYIGLSQVKDTCEPADLEAFALSAFERWKAAGCSPKELWALEALGHFGTDVVVPVLSTFAQDALAESGTARALRALEALATIGTDLALTHLARFTRLRKYPGIGERAQASLSAAAARRQLSADELADRLMPDLGLEATGTLTLDYGPRSFTVGFDERLRPFVRDGAGRLDKLPRPAKSDDTAKAKAAMARWKELQQEAEEIVDDQLHRFEAAMLDGRRWRPEAFETIRRHPFIRHLASRLVWIASEPEGAMRTSFRIAEDGTLADVADQTIVLPAGALIGVAHPLLLGDEVSQWVARRDDYQIIQPFPQLAREVFRVTSEERRIIRRFEGKTAHLGPLLGLLARRWTTVGSSEVQAISRALPGGTVVVTVSPGWRIGAAASDEVQTLGPLELQGQTTFGSLDPVDVSEVLRDLSRLA